MDRLGLPPETIKADLIEIGRGEARIERRGKTPRPIVKTLAGYVDVVGVEHAVDEACGHVAGGKACGAAYGVGEQALWRVGAIVFSEIMFEAIGGEAAQFVLETERRRAVGNCRCEYGHG